MIWEILEVTVQWAVYGVLFILAVFVVLVAIDELRAK